MWAIRVSVLILSSGMLLAQAELTGDAARGKAIVEGKGNCLSCHQIKNVGSLTGPDLSQIGARGPQRLETKLLTPDAEIDKASRPYRVTLKNGTVVDGRLLNEDTFTVQLMDDKENLRSFVKSDLRDYVFVEKSPMPSYRDKLSSQEIADVVSYLGTLRPPPGAGRGRGGAPPAAAAGGGAVRIPTAPAEQPH